MDDEHGNPERWYKSFRHRNDKAGIIVWIFLAILLAVLIICVLASHNEGCFDCGNVHSAYITGREQIQNAVTGYSANNNGSLPTLNGTYTNANCSNCRVINISALLTANGGVLRTYPNGLNLSANGNDNCGGNASLGCRNSSSYIWIVDTYGTVYSYCAGADCKTNNSGYQGVWP